MDGLGVGSIDKEGNRRYFNSLDALAAEQPHEICQDWSYI
jgi:hypothetical protein